VPRTALDPGISLNKGSAPPTDQPVAEVIANDCKPATMPSVVAINVSESEGRR
jgi:hypothetical protein